MCMYMHCTFGCFSASFHWTEGSGLEEPWPTIVGPKILARLSLGILLASEKEATLERYGNGIHVTSSTKLMHENTCTCRLLHQDKAMQSNNA